MFKGLRGCTKS